MVKKVEVDLGLIPSQEQSKISILTVRSSISNKYQEAGYKLLTRLYCTPQILHTMFSEIPNRCWRCGASPRSLPPIFWTCSKLKWFWNQVFKVIIQESPYFYSLHHNQFSFYVYKYSIVRHLVNAACTCIPALWEKRNHQ